MGTQEFHRFEQMGPTAGSSLGAHTQTPINFTQPAARLHACRYETVRKTAESRMGSRIARAKAEPVERNMDGSVKV